MRPSSLMDVFTVPLLDGYLLYMPRRSLVLGVEPAVHNLIEQLKQGELVEPSAFTAAWLDALHTLGAMEDVPDPCPLVEPFRPTHVTLSLTRRCSLRCVYCYARAGESEKDLDPRAARAALEVAANNALELGLPEFQVAFHGEGEPTHAWHLFQECVEHAETLADDRGIKVKFSMSTNAIWGRAKRGFIASHFQHVSVSLDGLPEIQDIQRPTPNGKGSFKVVLDNLQAMDAASVAYGVRSTVLPTGVGHMLPFLEFLAEHTRTTTLTLEPVFQSGRGSAFCIDKPAFYREFTDAFRIVHRRGAALGLDVTYSGCRPTVTAGRFCQAIGRELNFVVMTNGLVSSCYEINDPESEKGRLLVYGRFDPATGTFVFDEEKLTRLRGHGVWNMPGCRNCFAKWNCGGDCLARCDLTLAALQSGPDRTGSPRCGLNRALTFEALARYGISADFLRNTLHTI